MANTKSVKFIWNKSKTACVDIVKIKEITVNESNFYGSFIVRGWYANGKQDFLFGTFDTEDEARKWVDHNIVL